MPKQKPPRIVIVDDNPVNLNVLAAMVRSSNYAVDLTDSGITALKIIEASPPDLILLDIMMPEMDGLEVCRRLKHQDSTKDIPVIFISALTETESKLNGFHAGGVDYITKPFQKEEVLARIQVHLNLKYAQEELLRKNELLRRANNTKNKLFSIISHDLRGPISALMTLLELLAHSPEHFTEEEKKTLLNHLSLAVKSTSDLLENLFCWAQTQRGTIRFQPEILQLNPIIDQTVKLFAGIARVKKLRILTDLQEPVEIHADGNLLRTVIRNLLSNSVKFTPENGEIKIKTEMSGSTVTVSISDNGVGIPEKIQSLLFNVNEQISTTGTSGEKGSGLGLILCKEFVEKHGGTIHIESQEGFGSIVTFVLPALHANKNSNLSSPSPLAG
jgi:two-component system sensor histidine kinase/response regulator